METPSGDVSRARKLERWGRMVFPLNLFRLRSEMKPEVPKSVQLCFIVASICATIGAFTWRAYEAGNEYEILSEIVVNKTSLEDQGYTCKIITPLSSSRIMIIHNGTCADKFGLFSRVYITDIYYPSYEACAEELDRRIDNCIKDNRLPFPPENFLYIEDDRDWFNQTLFPELCSCFDQEREQLMTLVCDKFKFHPPYQCEIQKQQSWFGIWNSSINFVDFVTICCLILASVLVVFFKILSSRGSLDLKQIIFPFVPDSFFSLRANSNLKIPSQLSWIVMSLSFSITIIVATAVWTTYLSQETKEVRYQAYFSTDEGYVCKRTRSLSPDEVNVNARLAYQKAEDKTDYILRNFIPSYTGKVDESLCVPQNFLNDVNCVSEVSYSPDDSDGFTGNTMMFFPTEAECVESMADFSMKHCQVFREENFNFTQVFCKMPFGGSSAFTFGIFFTRVPFDVATLFALQKPLDDYVFDLFLRLQGNGFLIDKLLCHMYFEDGLYPPYECSRTVPKFSTTRKLSYLTSISQSCFFVTCTVLTFGFQFIASRFQGKKSKVRYSGGRKAKANAFLDQVLYRMSPTVFYSPHAQKTTLLSVPVILAINLAVFGACLGGWVYLILSFQTPTQLQFFPYSESNTTLEVPWNQCTYVGTPGGFPMLLIDFPKYVIRFISFEDFRSKEECYSELMSFCQEWYAGNQQDYSVGLKDLTVLTKNDLLPSIADATCDRFGIDGYCDRFSRPPGFCSIPKPESSLTIIGTATGVVELAFLIFIWTIDLVFNLKNMLMKSPLSIPNPEPRDFDEGPHATSAVTGDVQIVQIQAVPMKPADVETAKAEAEAKPEGEAGAEGEGEE